MIQIIIVPVIVSIILSCSYGSSVSTYCFQSSFVCSCLSQQAWVSFGSIRQGWGGCLHVDISGVGPGIDSGLHSQTAASLWCLSFVQLPSLRWKGDTFLLKSPWCKCLLHNLHNLDSVIFFLSLSTSPCPFFTLLFLLWACSYQALACSPRGRGCRVNHPLFHLTNSIPPFISAASCAAWVGICILWEMLWLTLAVCFAPYLKDSMCGTPIRQDSNWAQMAQQKKSIKY